MTGMILIIVEINLELLTNFNDEFSHHSES